MLPESSITKSRSTTVHSASGISDGVSSLGSPLSPFVSPLAPSPPSSLVQGGRSGLSQPSSSPPSYASEGTRWHAPAAPASATAAASARASQASRRGSASMRVAGLPYDVVYR